MSASSAYVRHGVTRSLIHHLAINYFHYPSEYQDTLKSYYIHHWTGTHTMSEIHDGIITHAGTAYLVVFQNCTPYNVSRSQHPVRLSFRVCIDDFNIPPYVIVRLYNE